MFQHLANLLAAFRKITYIEGEVTSFSITASFDMLSVFFCESNRRHLVQCTSTAAWRLDLCIGFHYSQPITLCQCHSGISLGIRRVRGYMCNCSVKLSLEKNPAARLAAWLSGSELTEGQSGKSLTRNDSFFSFLFCFCIF